MTTVTWWCEYCGRGNPASFDSCKGCGAGRPKPMKPLWAMVFKPDEKGLLHVVSDSRELPDA